METEQTYSGDDTVDYYVDSHAVPIVELNTGTQVVNMTKGVAVLKLPSGQISSSLVNVTVEPSGTGTVAGLVETRHQLTSTWLIRLSL